MEHLPKPPDGDVTSRGKVLISIVSVLVFLTALTTSLRLYVRYMKRQYGYDDLFIALATCVLLVQLAFSALLFDAGGGRHAYYLDRYKTARVLKWTYLSEITLFFVVCLTKISICLFILRIKKTGWLKWALYALMAGLVITTTGPLVILFAQCRPLHAYWDIWERKEGTCWNVKVYNDSIQVQVGMSKRTDIWKRIKWALLERPVADDGVKQPTLSSRIWSVHFYRSWCYGTSKSTQD